MTKVVNPKYAKPVFLPTKYRNRLQNFKAQKGRIIMKKTSKFSENDVSDNFKNLHTPFGLSKKIRRQAAPRNSKFNAHS